MNLKYYNTDLYLPGYNNQRLGFYGFGIPIRTKRIFAYLEETIMNPYYYARISIRLERPCSAEDFQVTYSVSYIWEYPFE